jgi:hypothetical protein
MEKPEILGFSETAKNILFCYKSKYVIIKHTLPKNELVAFLDINPFQINKDFRDKILKEAGEKGIYIMAYSINGINFFKDPVSYYLLGYKKSLYEKYFKKEIYDGLHDEFSKEIMLLQIKEYNDKIEQDQKEFDE